MVALHPIDRFEVQLRQKTASGEDLLHEDLTVALEFSALRWLWWHSERQDLLDALPGLLAWPALRMLRALAGHFELFAPERGRRAELRRGATRVGVQQLNSLASYWEPQGLFTHFLEQFRSALRGAGMNSQFASALAGAFHEMASNAVEHANAPAMPVACFEVAGERWAFAVVDVGRGALASIRENPAYGNLSNETEALALVLQPGVSRITGGGHGNGFTTVFKSLVDRRVNLRFRSGGAGAQWEGVSPTSQVIRSQSLPLSGVGFRVRVAGSLNGT